MSVQVEDATSEFDHAPASTQVQNAGLYLTMRLGEETYAVDILAVREIIEPVSITRIPRAPGFVRGVINLRGKVISIVDLPCRLGMRPIEVSALTVFIVLQYEIDGREESFGVIVDEVLEVVSMSDEDVSPPPEIGDSSTKDNFLKGVGRVEGNVIFILDLTTALSGSN